MNQVKQLLIKRIIKSDGFKIYFWPIVICYFFTFVCAFLFTPFKADSPRETIFVFIGDIAWLICLWVLVVRYQKVKGKSIGKRAIALLVILSAIILSVILVGLTLCAFRFFRFK
ncbi:MAG: hypothetical protein PHQ35_03755 [Phycisphaerae bacterium]|nr:hypothetical protein [Phycisphaerae bacterium]MDD5380592.1 hypothetical protein [Phycisphaerae bacterium]